MMQRLAAENPDKTVVSLDPLVCPCSTMFRIDEPHLAWCLESLVARRGREPDRRRRRDRRVGPRRAAADARHHLTHARRPPAPRFRPESTVAVGPRRGPGGSRGSSQDAASSRASKRPARRRAEENSPRARRALASGAGPRARTRCRGPGRRRRRGHDVADVADDPGHPSDVGDDRSRAPGHRLEQRGAERLVAAGRLEVDTGVAERRVRRQSGSSRPGHVDVRRQRPASRGRRPPGSAAPAGTGRGRDEQVDALAACASARRRR